MSTLPRPTTTICVLTEDFVVDILQYLTSDNRRCPRHHVARSVESINYQSRGTGEKCGTDEVALTLSLTGTDDVGAF